MSELGSILRLQYGAALSAEKRTGWGYPVFGSNGEVGRHAKYLIGEAGIVVGRKGSVGQVSWSDEPYWPIDTAYWVDCREQERRWLYWLLSYLPLKRLDTSTGVPGLNRNDVYEICVYRPDPASRDKIAKILDTLDAAIRGTEAVVTKLRALKQGLLHDLLTRGIDANGDLRPRQPEAPHLYKRTSLGWVPKDWKETDVFCVSTTVTSGSRDWARYYSEDGAVFVRIGNLTREHVNLRLASLIYVRPPSNADGQRTSLEEGDVLVSITADLGIVGVIPADFGEAYINQHVALVRPNKKLINPRFLSHFLAAPLSQNHLSKLNDAGAKAGLNLPTIRGLPVLMPHTSEQDQIAERLDQIDGQIGKTKVEASKLKSMKSGLMEDLLTGRATVTALL